ncbi:UDP-3-O-acyl-N-acetylglucosamine deacetylase [Celerinatantimonas yamalensis]|uniref:UDP-3-O-acyl-N-acetylglucosamine deacetylase n=1 Tax=Celerinatantimonas yamalensis TaxID=559956 RepID=A0ABW9G6B1_9GAMM
MIKQRTLTKPVHATGIGLHSGNKVTIALNPAPINTGIVFHRVDLSPMVVIPARADLVKDTTLCTGLVDEQGHRIATVEHLLSAVAALGLDNLIVEVDAPEIPIMDGSSSPFVFLLQSAGIQEQSALKRFIQIKQTVRVEADEGKWAELRPNPAGFKIDFAIDFQHPAIAGRNQSISMDFDSLKFVKELSRARTFCFLHDVEFMQAHNLALGGSLDNAIVLDDYRIMNDDGLRYEDEFVRHKVLDAIGDLCLTGHSILGHLCAYKSGHALNNMLARQLLATPEAYEVVTFDDEAAEVPMTYSQPIQAF